MVDHGVMYHDVIMIHLITYRHEAISSLGSSSRFLLGASVGIVAQVAAVLLGVRWLRLVKMCLIMSWH